MATFAAPLSRSGPGLLLRDLQKGADDEISAIVALIDDASPDVLLLTDFDYDLDGFALKTFSQILDGPYPYLYSAQPNAGVPTGLDIDGNGRLGEARDAQGYGEFSGDGGMAILSRFPFGEVTDLSDLLWQDVPGAVLPPMTPETALVQRLSSTNHWMVPIALPNGDLQLMAYSATPPVFDGPEDRNGLRNRDELMLWTTVLDGVFGHAPDSFVILGNANLDPQAGDGIRAAMGDFLGDPRLQDPLPGIATAYWPHLPELGELRVSYVLPSQDWMVTGAQVMRLAPDQPSKSDDSMAAGPHRLVWVDISR
ncbi:endonuclease/exonuclease/phosphatase family protein [Yoonia maritima]|uniref:endonuclease/exonuclease/phosphatase family protein n=1 Tax=Yoonia maritima TaxID=1435347 RepID=UPI000D0E6C9B|nr:endonuclease/exonuclease/phosphatase family protein [Yoonia maritima]